MISSLAPWPNTTLNFQFGLLLDGEVPQCRLENLADRRDRQPLQDDDALGLRRRLHDVAFQVDFQAAQIDDGLLPAYSESL